MFVLRATDAKGRTHNHTIELWEDASVCFEVISAYRGVGLTGCVWLIPGSYELVA